VGGYGWIAVDEAVQNTVKKTSFTAYGEPT
jgi:hypothetical protein